MNDFAGLNAKELESLLFTIETSLKVNKRFQFFLWAQGSLQIFIPHAMMLCAYGDIARLNYRYEVFAADAVQPEKMRDLGDPIDGLTPRIVDEWLRGGCEPWLFGPSAGGVAGNHAVRINGKGLGNVVAHGAKEMQGEFGSFFVFLGVPQPPSTRDAYLLELFMPYLHMALHRMLANESREGSEGGTGVAPESVLSLREIEVLHCVKDGKTNQEIGLILSISPLTVKNHVQKILRKLKVSNRAQAVGKGAASRLFVARSAPQPGEGG